MDASKLKNKEATKSDLSQDASNKKDQEKGESDYVYAPVGQGINTKERTMFMVDLSRLKAEGDTLENALVLYRPEADIKQSQYEQRCSQLIGLSLCTNNFTGKFPEFLRLHRTSYAILSLEDQYLISLSSRFDEPPSYCVQYLKLVMEMFRFYYHTPQDVLEANHQDWDMFCTAMSRYIGGILDYIIRDQHSVPAMLNPLPYIQTDHYKKNAQRLYLLASRILKACQTHMSIVGGCILHCGDLLLSQFPPEITEKLMLIGGDGISLDTRTVLADNIAPGKVWVVEVYLTRDEENVVTDYRKDHRSLQAVYSTLSSSHHLTASTKLKAPATDSTTNNGGQRSKNKWRSKPIKSSVSQSQSCDSGLSSIAGNLPPLALPSQDFSTPGRSVVTRCDPVDSSTPIQKNTNQKKLTGTMCSEDAVVFSPGMSTVSFDASVASTDSRGSPSTANKGDDTLRRTSSSNSSVKQDGDESEYVDAVETIDPTMAITTQTANLVNPLSTNATSQPQPIVRDSDAVFIDSRPCSVSSEGFATPSPSPPKEGEKFSTPGNSFSISDSGTLQSMLNTEAEETKQDTLTRLGGASDSAKAVNPKEMTDEELAALINSPVQVAEPTNKLKISSMKQNTQVMALPRSWNFRKSHDSDSDDDFVDSEALQQMLSDAKTQESGSNTLSNSRCSPPPPLPPRNLQTSTRSLSHPPVSPRTSLGGSSSAPPPLPPRNYASTSRNVVASSQADDETDFEKAYTYLSEVPSGTRSKAWLYTTMERGKTGAGLDGGPGALKEYAQGLVESDEFTDSKETQGQEMNGNKLRNDKDVDGVIAESDVVHGVSFDGEEVPNSMEEIELSMSKSDQSETTVANTKEVLGSSDDRLSNRSNTMDIYSDGPVNVGKTGSVSQTSEETQKENGKVLKVKHDTEKGSTTRDTETTLKTTTSDTHTNTEQSTGKAATDQDYDDVDEESVIFKLDPSTDKTGHTGDSSARDSENSTSNGSILYQLGAEKKEKFSSRASRLQVRSRDTSENLSHSDMELSYSDAGTDGTVTPVEMTYNPGSILQQLPLKLAQATPPTPPPRAPSKPKRSKRIREGDNSSTEDETSTDGESSDADSNVAMAVGNPRGGTKQWIAKTINRPPSSGSVGPHVTKMCLYVQQYMGAKIVLLADSGLHKDHAVLNSLWRSLLHQLMELDVGLKKDGTDSLRKKGQRPNNLLVTYSNYNRHCEAIPTNAPYHFRHALRRIHQEYTKDPSLLQISFSKEHLRVLSQCVHEREVYLQPGRLGHLDALGMHGAIEKYAKHRNSLRQQPIGGPKVMFV